MRFFLRSRQFKKTIAVIAIILAITITVGLFGGFMAPQAGIIGTITTPFQKLSNSIVGTFIDFTENFKSAAELSAKNEALEAEINELKDQLVNYYDILNQNEDYKKYLEIKELNPDFKFCPAMVTAVDPDDIFGGFTLDSGSLHGVSLYDPVITDAGLVGFITEVGLTTSKVTTILSPSLVCGAYDSRTNDAGALSGATELATQNQTRFYNLPRTCSVAVGDIIVTSGSGIFPAKIVLGTVSNIASDPISSSLYATVTPTVDFSDLRNVMIITDFNGKGNELISGDK